MKRISVFASMLLCLALLLTSTGCRKSGNTPPSIPTNLTCTSICSDNTPTFTWDAAFDDDSGVDHYQMSLDGGATEFYIGNATEYTVEHALSDGDYTFWVAAVDRAGNKGTAARLDFTIDRISPIITSVTASGMSATYARIRWSTDEGATSQVEYGATSSYGSSSYLDSSLDTIHTIHLTGLSAETTYHFRVTSRDTCGNEAISDDDTFSTVQPAPGVNILSHSSYVDDVGHYDVVGEVENTGNQAVGYVVVAATFYNAAGTVVGTDSNSRTPIYWILANQKSPFLIRVAEEGVAAQIDHYELAIADAMVLTEQPYTAFTILSESLRTGISGDYHVVGEVQNTGSQTATYVEVVATFYDSAQMVVAAAYAVTDPSSLAGGQTGHFDINVSSSARSGKISRYELQVVGIVPPV